MSEVKTMPDDVLTARALRLRDAQVELDRLLEQMKART